MLLATNSEIPYRLIHTNEFNRNIYLLWLVPLDTRNRTASNRSLPIITPNVIALIIDFIR